MVEVLERVLHSLRHHKTLVLGELLGVFQDSLERLEALHKERRFLHHSMQNSSEKTQGGSHPPLDSPRPEIRSQKRED